MVRLGKISPSGGIPQAYRGAFDNAAQKTGVDVGLLGAIASAESSFNPSVTSSAGAQGLMQLMPDTARGMGIDSSDPLQNVLGGAYYIKSMLSKYGSKEVALAAYNAGPGNVDKAIAKAGSNNWSAIKQYLPQETQNYVPKVMGKMG